MKKLFMLFWGILAALNIQAQSDFPVQFADKDGNIIDSETTLTLTEYESDAFGSIEMPTNLYVKNMTDESIQIGGVYTIQTLDNGIFQTCFPNNCVVKSETGTFETGTGAINAGELKNMQTEWMPTENGRCVVVYQLVTYKKNTFNDEWSKDQYGPTITLDFTLNTTGIRSADINKKIRSITYYDLTGQKVSKPKHGVYLKKTVYQDGTSTTRKKLFR